MVLTFNISHFHFVQLIHNNLHLFVELSLQMQDLLTRLILSLYLSRQFLELLVNSQQVL